MDVVALLRSKNRCLERFLEISADFLKSAEKGDFSTLKRFEESRESALKGFQLYDRKLSEYLSALPIENRTTELASELEAEIQRKDSLLRGIFTVDERITHLLREEQSRILRELATTQKSSTTVKKFKSGWIPESGEGLDQKI